MAHEGIGTTIVETTYFGHALKDIFRWYNDGMHFVPENDRVFRQMVTQSPAQTNMPLRARGYEIMVNPLVDGKQWLGGENNKLEPRQNQKTS